MTVDFAGLLYDPQYNVFGASAVLTVAESNVSKTLTVIDQTTGFALPAVPGQGADVSTIRPVAFVRTSELTEQSLAMTDLHDANVEFNGKTWLVKSHRPRPGPEGETSGEVMLILSELD